MRNDLPQTSCPYKGLQPYTEDDRQYFFGRERDQAIIAANLYAAPLTVLYGASGVGKSSVLLAGVVPQLREDAQVAVVVFRTWQGTSYQTALKGEVLSALRRAGHEPGDIDLGLPFDEFLLACNKSLPFRGRILFIFDQFEEYFHNPADPRAEDNFDAEFARAVNRREIPATFLLSMRDDGLSKLDRFQGRIPNLMSNLLRVEHLALRDARVAVTRPLDIYNAGLPGGRHVTIEGGLVEAVLGKAKLALDKEGGAAPPPSPEDWPVETPVLQILLTRLWKEEVKAESNRLRLSTFADQGAENIVSGYLREVMEGLGEDEREVAARILQFLVTPAKTKIAHEPGSLADWSGVPESRVQSLLDRLSAREDKVLRKVQVAGQPVRYEIFHDVLGAPIYDWREKYVHERQVADEARRAAEEAEKKAREEAARLEAAAQQREAEQALLFAQSQARAARRLRWLVAAVSVLFLFSLFSTRYAFSERAAANALREDERKRREDAEQRERETRRLKDEAEENFKTAREQSALAISNSQKAEAQLQQATKDAAAKIEEANRQAAAKIEEANRQASARVEQANRDAAAKVGEADAKVAEANQKLLDAAAREQDSKRLLDEAKEREQAALAAKTTAEDLVRQLTEERDQLREEAARLAKELEGRAEGTGDALRAEGIKLEADGKLAEAADSYSRAAARYRAEANPLGVATAGASLGDVYVKLKNYAGAVKAYEEVLGFYKSAGDVRGQANLNRRIGLVWHAQAGDRPQAAERQLALERFKQALDIYTDAKDFEGQAATLDSIGDVYLAAGSYPQAIENYIKAEKVYDNDLNNEAGEAQMDFMTGFAYQSQGNKLESAGDRTAAQSSYQEADTYYKRSLEHQTQEQVELRIETLQHLGEVNRSLGREQDAAEFFRQAQALRGPQQQQQQQRRRQQQQQTTPQQQQQTTPQQQQQQTAPPQQQQKGGPSAP